MRETPQWRPETSLFAGCLYSLIFWPDEFYVFHFRTIIHGSDSVESAEKEIALWFSKQEEIVDWTPAVYKYIYEKWFIITHL